MRMIMMGTQEQQLQHDLLFHMQLLRAAKEALHSSSFILQVCFDHKPRIISKTNKDEPSLCSHPVTKHDFELHK